MEGAAAQFVRIVDRQELLPQLVALAKALTYEHECEHAVLDLHDGRRVLVKGGRYGIDLVVGVRNDPLGRQANALYVGLPDGEAQVASLVFHTHPEPTGPSDGDLKVLEMLSQNESMLYELFGPAEGTVIRPKVRRAT